MTVPLVSVVIVSFNIGRELPRSLETLTAPYQRHIDAADIEVVVVDNGSQPRVDSRLVESFGRQVRLVRIENASASPAAAINVGIATASADVIGVMVDGARMLTPGLLHYALHGARLFPRAIVATLGWYLGADMQRCSMGSGYTREAEDDLLASIDWRGDGYRLTEISTLDESSLNGWFAPLSESNALFASRSTWAALGGAEERFDAPGGGLLNLDIFTRAVSLEGAQLVTLLGEGTFHQLHGGVSTNAPGGSSERWNEWAAQYEQIRGRPYRVPPMPSNITYLGTLPRSVLTHFARAVLFPLEHHPAPLGEDFDLLRWTDQPKTPSGDVILDGLLDIVYAEMAARRLPVAARIARLARTRAPGEAEPQRLLRFLAAHSPDGDIRPAMIMPFHRAMASAYELMGDTASADFHRGAARSPSQS